MAKASDNNVAELLAMQLLLQREPWRGPLQITKTLVATLLKDKNATRNAAKLQLLEQAKAAQLTPLESMLLSYTSFGTEEDLVYLNHVLATFAGVDRYLAHNRYVLAQASEIFVATHGEKISSLVWPLFPTHESFLALNLRLLGWEGSCTGGGGLPPVYKHLEPEGGNACFVVQQDGQKAFVDLTPVELSYCALDARISAIERDRGRGNYQGHQRGMQSSRGQHNQRNYPQRGANYRTRGGDAPQPVTPGNTMQTEPPKRNF